VLCAACTRTKNNIPLLGITIKKHIQVRPDLKAIGRRIREIRGFDLTQAEFGRILGVGQTQLSKYEMGQSVPTLELLLRLRGHSGRSIDWIVTGEGGGPGKT
jgi:DNA-binding XRE family transcriptional regulator